MKFGRTRSIRFFAVLFLVVCTFNSCIFSPKEEKDGPKPEGTWEEPKAPDNVLHNLKLAFDDLNIEYYRKCLHDNYFYLSRSEVDNQDIRWSKSEDVMVIDKLMKGTTKFVFNAVENSRTLEYGKEYPDIPVGATVVPEHPSEVWTVINYTVDMEIFTKSFGDLNVHQFMEFKFYKDPVTGLYSIVLWNDLTNL